MNEIEHWYDNEYDEWARLERHKIEFDMTLRYLDEYIVGDDLQILDIGGGPGRYSIYLAEKGHKVTLLDLSKRNIEVAKRKSFERGITLKDYIHGDALELDQYEQKYDVVLLMGPVYHLLKELDRKKAVEGALRLLKPNGLIIASFISNYAPIQASLSNLSLNESVADLLGYLKNGINKDKEGFTTAFFIDYQEARAFMNGFGLKEKVLAGIENILGSKEKEILQLNSNEYEKWIELAYHLSKDENLIGTSQHFLYIGCK